MVIILYCSFAKSYHWTKLGKSYIRSLYYFLQMGIYNYVKKLFFLIIRIEKKKKKSVFVSWRTRRPGFRSPMFLRIESGRDIPPGRTYASELPSPPSPLTGPSCLGVCPSWDSIQIPEGRPDCLHCSSLPPSSYSPCVLFFRLKPFPPLFPPECLITMVCGHLPSKVPSPTPMGSHPTGHK